jgi:hypothetical protein
LCYQCNIIDTGTKYGTQPVQLSKDSYLQYKCVNVKVSFDGKINTYGVTYSSRATALTCILHLNIIAHSQKLFMYVAFRTTHDVVYVCKYWYD